MKTTINHVNKIICFYKVRTGTTSQFTWCHGCGFVSKNRKFMAISNGFADFAHLHLVNA